jgi:hypothetical protein
MTTILALRRLALSKRTDSNGSVTDGHGSTRGPSAARATEPLKLAVAEASSDGQLQSVVASVR